MKADSLRTEPGNTHDGVCDCCGERSRTVSGFVYRGSSAKAAYFVQWTVGAAIVIPDYRDLSAAVRSLEFAGPEMP